MEKIVKSRDGNVIENVFPQAEEVIENAKVKGSEYWEMAKEKGKSFWKGSKGFIQKHPAQAVGYAVLLGAVLTILLYPKAQD